MKIETNTISIRRVRPEELEEYNELILNVFHKTVALDYSKRGIEEFVQISTLESTRKRYNSGNYMSVAIDDNKIIGVVEVRDSNHISRFFVATNYHRKGIGRLLLQNVLNEYPELQKLTVNSSPYAIKAYTGLGFTQNGPKENHEDGIVSIPLVYTREN